MTDASERCTMTVSERDRRELQEAVVGTIGPDPTDTLLGYLPPTGWADVATKRDLDALEGRLDARIHRLDGKVEALGERLDGRIDGLGGRLDGRIDGLEGRIDGLGHKLDTVAARLEGQLHRELHKQDRWLFAITITIVLALFTQVLALLVPRFVA